MQSPRRTTVRLRFVRLRLTACALRLTTSRRPSRWVGRVGGTRWFLLRVTGSLRGFARNVAVGAALGCGRGRHCVGRASFQLITLPLLGRERPKLPPPQVWGGGDGGLWRRRVDGARARGAALGGEGWDELSRWVPRSAAELAGVGSSLRRRAGGGRLGSVQPQKPVKPRPPRESGAPKARAPKATPEGAQRQKRTRHPNHRAKRATKKEGAAPITAPSAAPKKKAPPPITAPSAPPPYGRRAKKPGVGAVVP